MPPSSSKHKISAFQFSHPICVSCFVFPRASLHGRKPMQIMATRAASDPVSSGVQTTVLEAQQGNQQAKHFYCFLAAPPVLDDPREFPQGTPNRRLPRSSSPSPISVAVAWGIDSSRLRLPGPTHERKRLPNHKHRKEDTRSGTLEVFLGKIWPRAISSNQRHVTCKGNREQGIPSSLRLRRPDQPTYL